MKIKHSVNLKNLKKLEAVCISALFIVALMLVFSSSGVVSGTGHRAHNSVRFHHANGFKNPTPTATPTLAPTQTPKSTTTPTPDKTPTPTPAPTQTQTTSGVVQQSSASSPLNAIWIQQAVEDYLNQNQQAIVQKLLDSNIKIVFVQVGNWHQSNAGVVSIDYWLTPSVMQTMINSIHSYSNGQIGVHAWMYWSIPESQGGVLVNLSDPAIRQQAVNVAVNCVQTYGFDGFNDDLVEGFSGTNADYISFANDLGTALHNVNKVSSADLMTIWNLPSYAELYKGINKMDFICTMLYGPLDMGNWNEANTVSNLNQALAASGTRVLAGIMVSRTGNGYTCGEILGWIGHPTNSKFAGVSIWNSYYMQNDDWISLHDWADGG